MFQIPTPIFIFSTCSRSAPEAPVPTVVAEWEARFALVSTSQLCPASYLARSAHTNATICAKKQQAAHVLRLSSRGVD